MEKPTYKLVGQPCGHHGQYTFYKALRLSGPKERIIAIGDFFFVRIWQDSELVSVGELQLLWKDRVSEQTLVSVRLYFLPENTPDGRNLHGEDYMNYLDTSHLHRFLARIGNKLGLHEVLAISDKVVLKAEDLLSWICTGESWTWGMRAVWRGACAPPAEDKETAPLHHTKLDFSDVDKEKSTIVVEPEDPGVVVFSYPRYCRYRAVSARLEGLQADWLRDSLVAALGGYAAPTKNTRILYCKDTFEYPELEGHEFVCNHLAPKLKGRPRGRRRRQQRSQTQSPESRSSEDEKSGMDFVSTTPPSGPRRLSLRNGPEKTNPGEEVERKYFAEEERDFLRRLKHFYKDRNESLSKAITLKHISLNAIYAIVTSRGGYDAVCRHKLWRVLFTDQPVYTRRHYERYLLAFEHHERRNGLKHNGLIQPIDTIHVSDSPLREDKPHSPLKHIDSETGEIKEESMHMISKPASELNLEFLASLPKEEQPKLAVKHVVSLMEPGDKPHWMNDRGPPEYMGDVTLMHPLPMLYPPTSVNGHPHNGTPLEQKPHRPAGRSSLRAVRVKPTRQNAQPATAPNTPPTAYPLLAESLSAISPPAPPHSAPPITNFGIHHPPPAVTAGSNSDDEIVEVPYKPKTPEIIDLDEYPETESPDSSSKKKRLDILKERGLEVTPLPAPWPTPITPVITPNPLLLNPAVQQQIMASQLYGYYTPPVVVAYPNGVLPPKVIQATSIFGSSCPEKTVYGNPKDPFMPPPHVLHGVPIKPQRVQVSQTPPNHPQDILDLTCKLTKPAVEIVRVPSAPSPSKPQTHNVPKNYSIVDGKAVVGSNLEITLVNKAQTPPKKDPIRPQKRSSNGKFLAKTPTPPKDPKVQKKPAIVVPSYQIRDEPSPTGSATGSTSSRESQKEPQKPMSSFLDPYMALYSLAGQMDPRQLMGGQIDPRQIAAYREAMVNQFRGYSHLLNMGVTNPTTKN